MAEQKILRFIIIPLPLPSHRDHNVNIQLYADDTVIFVDGCIK